VVAEAVAVGDTLDEAVAVGVGDAVVGVTVGPGDVVDAVAVGVGLGVGAGETWDLRPGLWLTCRMLSDSPDAGATTATPATVAASTATTTVSPRAILAERRAGPDGGVVSGARCRACAWECSSRMGTVLPARL